jgi:excisionase family DNA binding protein
MRYLHSIQETCHLLNIGRTKLYALVNQRELELVKIGSKSLITASSLNALVARLTKAKRGNPDTNAIGAQKSRGA